jgi:ABC-2 type transport system permease protein
LSRLEWLPVARWEAERTLKRGDFLFSVLALPVLIGGAMGVVGWFQAREAKKAQKIAVVAYDPGGAVRATPLPQAERYEWIVPPPAERSLDALKRAVNDRRYEGAVILPESYADRGGVQIIVRRANNSWRRALTEQLTAQARRERAAAFGIDTAGLRRLDTPIQTSLIATTPAGRVTGPDRVASLALMVVLMTSLFVTSAYMAIGVTGEKQARVTEVIVSAIRPQSWIDGKIAAFTVIGIAQAALWIGSVALVPILFRVPFPANMNAGVLGMSTLFFLVGLLLFISLYALILATIKDLQSTSKAQAYLYFLPMVPFIFMEGMLRSPDAPWVMAMSQVPFFAPFMMPLRMGMAAVQPWELALSLALMLIAAWLLRRAAGVAFRVAMLMYGKELTLPELIRWAKVS